MTVASTAAQAAATKYGMHNVGSLAIAADKAKMPFYSACALMEKESMGKNVYGHDAGGALSGYPHDVDESNFKVFMHLINTGHKSNGVGPAQITWKGFFPDMVRKGLKAWVPVDNMYYGFTLLMGYYNTSKSWSAAGTKYNGSGQYGADFNKKVVAWKKRVGSL